MPTRPAGVGPVEPVDPHAPRLTPPVLMHQDWRDLTYLHWAIDPARATALMPRGVRADVHDGVTYVGLVPFRMVDAGLGSRGRVAWLGTFLETNIRLYSVDDAGRRGVVFLSLDAARLVVVAGARAGFAVPYRWARMSHSTTPLPGAGLEASTHQVHTYRSRRRGPSRTPNPITEVAVRVGERREPTALDHFVSARWRLHTRVLGRTVLVPNAHEPWPIHDAEVVRLAPGLLAETGFADLVGRAPDHVAFSPGVHTEFGLPRPVR